MTLMEYDNKHCCWVEGATGVPLAKLVTWCQILLKLILSQAPVKVLIQRVA